MLCFLYVSSFAFKGKSHFQWRKQRKVVIDEEELDDIVIDDIGNLDDLPRLVFIDEECGKSKGIDWWWRAY